MDRRFTAVPLALACVLALGACSDNNSEAQPGSEENPISADNPSSHEELQNPDGGVITYGNPIPKDEVLHDVVVDGKERKSLFTQKNLDFATKSSVTREEYESAFLDFAACIEDRGGWIHYDLDSHVINYTMTSSSDPDDYCYNSHFNFPDSLWQLTQYDDGAERIQFYIDCLNDHDVEPVHAAPDEEKGPPQWKQDRELQDQIAEEGIDCGDFIESFYQDVPYPE